jgi:predicted PurR-regulated permease PerM
MPMLADNAAWLAAALTIAAMIIAALLLGREILLAFALAIVLAFMLAPIVCWLTRRHLPRGLAVAVTMLTVPAGTILASATFSAQLLSLTADLGGYRDNLVE